MEREAVRAKLNPIFQDVFDDPSLQAKDELTAANVEAWDSLSHLNLIAASEKAFKIKFTSAELRSFKDVGGLVTLIANKAS